MNEIYNKLLIVFKKEVSDSFKIPSFLILFHIKQGKSDHNLK